MEGKPKEQHTNPARVSVERKDGSRIDFALDKMVPYKIGVDTADDPATTRYFVYYDSLEKFSSEEPGATVHHSVEITYEEYKRILPIYNGYHKRIPGVDTVLPLSKDRKLEVIKYILRHFPNSTIYLNHVKADGLKRNEDLPEDQWGTLVNESEPYDVVDEVSTEELAGFFLLELMGICGCGIPNRIEYLTVYWLDLIEQNPGMARVLLQTPNGDAVTSQVDQHDYIWVFLYLLGAKGLTEHSAVITNSHITELGKMVRDVFKADLGI